MTGAGLAVMPGAREEWDARVGQSPFGERTSFRSVRRVVLVLLTAVLLLLPCVWQARIQAGDLGSHTYNAWLVNQVHARPVDGLQVRWQWTNILFDLLLSALVGRIPIHWAERVSVGILVEVLFWGAFFLASRISKRPPWPMAPLLAMLAYGWTFHMGLFNFYLATGLCFWALGLFWRRTIPSTLLGLLLMTVAIGAHAMPVAWAAGIAFYWRIAAMLKPRRFAALFVTSATLILAVARYLMNFEHVWSWWQSFSIAGADQVWLYGAEYRPIMAGVMLIGSALLVRLIQSQGPLRFLLHPLVQSCILTALAILAIPRLVWLPMYPFPINFISGRMSLPAAVLVCAVLLRARPGKWAIAGMAVLATAFFCLAFRDERALNRLETQMSELLLHVPDGARVVSTVSETNSRIDGQLHLIDRACVGRCFSYGNYEASTGQFRLRATGRNPVVVADSTDPSRIEMGRYVVGPDELPLYQVEFCRVADGGLCLRSLSAGVENGAGHGSPIASSTPTGETNKHVQTDSYPK